MSKVVVAVPALNEEATIGLVLDGLPRSLPGADSVEALVVDDGSTDATAERAREHGASVVSHHQNRGVGTAFRTAVAEALERGADVLVTVDADGQFDPAEVPTLVAPVLAGRADLVTASRFVDGRTPPTGMPRVKVIGNRFVARLISWITRHHIQDASCGFRACSREALLNLNLFGDFTYTQETILDLCLKNLRVVEVPATVRYFAGRRSRVASSVISYGWRALRIILKIFGTTSRSPSSACSALAGAGRNRIHSLLQHRIVLAVPLGGVHRRFL